MKLSGVSVARKQMTDHRTQKAVYLQKMARSPLICFSVFMQTHACLRTPPPETPDSFFGEKTYGVVCEGFSEGKNFLRWANFLGIEMPKQAKKIGGSHTSPPKG